MSVDGLVLIRQDRRRSYNISFSVLISLTAVHDGCPSSPSRGKTAVNRHVWYQVKLFGYNIFGTRHIPGEDVC